MCPQASHEVSVHTRPYSSNRVHGRMCSPPHLGHLMVRNQGDARKSLLAVARANHGDARKLPLA